ncbi:MAG: hypothetical protein KAU01_03705 [Candidatus Cloacimonetes bacterium]|nr:hypothetical protein [Candidatus Cloacimonadota bacterium]
MNIPKKAKKLNEYVNTLSDFKIYKIDDDYNHLGATLADAILQANRNFEIHIRPRIKRIQKLYSKAYNLEGLKEVLKNTSINEFLNLRGNVRVKCFLDLINLCSVENIKTESDLHDWLCDSNNLNKLRNIKGIGPKTVDYLKILVGIETTAVDRHLLKFIENAQIKISGYDEAHRIINTTADLLNVNRSDFDHSIWKYMTEKKKNYKKELNCKKNK